MDLIQEQEEFTMQSKKLKAFCLACASVLAIGICPVFSASAAQSNSLRAMGDADGNGEVSVEDAQSVLVSYVRSMSKNETIDAAGDPASDTNLDGVIDLLDANNILQFYCRTLSGDKPLWSDFRKVSEVTGYGNPIYETVEITLPDGTVMQVEQPSGQYSYITAGKKGMFLEIGVASGKPGDCVSVPVYVSGCPTIAGFQFFLNSSEGAQLKAIKSNINELLGDAKENNAVWNPDPNFGALVWCSERGENLDMGNGTVIGEYIYQIPEDAKPGTVYSLTIDKENTMFITTGEEYGSGFLLDEDLNACTYQFTLLDGAIAVE